MLSHTARVTENQYRVLSSIDTFFATSEIDCEKNRETNGGILTTLVGCRWMKMSRALESNDFRWAGMKMSWKQCFGT